MTFAGWSEDAAGLHRELEFRNFTEAWKFMSEVAELAERIDHHPDWANSWNRVSITLISHDAARVTDRDRKLAEMIDDVLAGFAEVPS